jgi:O-antigen ligase
VGSGSFRVEWRRKNVVPRGAFDAHSLYFETLGELGIAGGLLLGVFLVSIAAGVVSRARAVPLDPVLPGAAAVLAAYAVHVGVDWDWELPALILPALLLAGAALVAPEPDLTWHR